MQVDSGKRLRFGMVIPCNVGGSVHEHRDRNELLACIDKNKEYVTITNLSSKIEEMGNSMKEHQRYIEHNLDTAGIIGHENNTKVCAERERASAERARENAEKARTEAELAKANAEMASAKVEEEKNKRMFAMMKCFEGIDPDKQEMAHYLLRAMGSMSMDTTSDTQFRRNRVPSVTSSMNEHIN